MLDLPILQSQNARANASDKAKARDDNIGEPSETAFEREYEDSKGTTETSDPTPAIEADLVEADTIKPVADAEEKTVSEVTTEDASSTGDKSVESASRAEDVTLFAAADTAGKPRSTEKEIVIGKADQTTALSKITAFKEDVPPPIATKAEGGKEQRQPSSDIAPASNPQKSPENRSTAETVVMTRAVETTMKRTGGMSQVTTRSEHPPQHMETPNQIPKADLTSPSVSKPRAKSEDTRLMVPALPHAKDPRTPPKSDRDTFSETADLAPVRTPSASSVQTAVQGANQTVQTQLVTVRDGFDAVNHVLDDLEVTTSFDHRASQQTHSAHLQQALQRPETPAMIARQIAEALQKLPDRPVEISLNPKELGRVRMNISAVEAGITVSVVAERPETLDLMRRNIDQLAREFEIIGYSDINFSFSQGETQQEFSDEQQEPSRASASLLDLGHHAEGTANHTTALSTTGVDIRV